MLADAFEFAPEGVSSDSEEACGLALVVLALAERRKDHAGLSVLDARRRGTEIVLGICICIRPGNGPPPFNRPFDGNSGLPWLKDVPVLGWLFKGEGKSESMEEVLIFITPKILPATIAAVTPAGK